VRKLLVQHVSPQFSPSVYQWRAALSTKSPTMHLKGTTWSKAP